MCPSIFVCVVFLSVWALATIATSLPYEPIFHVRPPSNWAGAPSAPYRDPSTLIAHLYMQYNPYAAVEASTAWYHVTSRDYIHWTRATPAVALSAGKWYDADAVLSGVLMANNRSTPVVIYTCMESSEIQLQCMASASTTATGATDFNTLVKNANNPIIVPEQISGLDSVSSFRDPTEWWADPAASARWLVAFAARVTNSGDTRSHVVAFATTDPTFQSEYRFSHSLYVDNFTGGTATFEHPDFFAVTQNGQRYLKLSLREPRQDVVLYGTYAACEQQWPVRIHWICHPPSHIPRLRLLLRRQNLLRPGAQGTPNVGLD
jgi:sucrose-6-phosphate hydrolase SacC (GH32 family)